MRLELSVRQRSFAVKGGFTIARGTRKMAEVVVAHLRHADGAVGQGECLPYAHYGESVACVIAAIEAQHDLLRTAPDEVAALAALQTAMPADAARNALDSALWDLRAKRSGRPAWQLAHLPQPEPLVTVYTISVGAPETMAAQAKAQADRPILKIKLAGEGDEARIRAVRAAAPVTRLIVDANEAWSPEQLDTLMAAMAEAQVEMVEQPLPAGGDAELRRGRFAVPIGADESVKDAASLDALAGRYDVVNLKLDKTGGFTEALKFRERAHALGLDLMVGCMLASSLSMAPAFFVAQGARYVDLDAPLLLDEDHEPSLVYEGSLVHLPPPALWG